MLYKGFCRSQKAGSEHDNDALRSANDVFEVQRPVSQSPGLLRHDCHVPETFGNPGCTPLRTGILEIICNEEISLHRSSFLRQCMATMTFRLLHSAPDCPHVS